MAARRQDEMNDAGVAAARKQLAPEEPPKGVKFDGRHCIEEDCGEELPAVRIAYGRIRCTACQVRREAAEKRGRR